MAIVVRPDTDDLSEIATVYVPGSGNKFDDWESVWLQHRWTEDSMIFKFTAAERDPSPEEWNTLQIKPGDECGIYLGRKLAAAGIILMRQAAYDANQHGVMFMGKGRTWWAARGSIIADDEGMNFDGMTFEEVARKILAKFGVNVLPVGKPDETPFVKLSVHPGETVWSFLESIARPRKIILGSDHKGNFLVIGDHNYDIDASLIEGQNILRCQCIISIENSRSDFFARGQTAATDSQYGTAAAEQEARISGSAKTYSPLLTVAEQPVWGKAELFKRALAERQWNEGESVRCSITVQGWHMPDGNLWKAGGKYMVQSRMALLNQVLKAETVTYSQDNQGTLTTLDLVAPYMLNDGSDIGVPTDYPLVLNPSLLPNQPDRPATEPEKKPPDYYPEELP